MHNTLIKSWVNLLASGPEEQLLLRMASKARNAAGVARERERKKTPQQRDPKKAAWAGLVAEATENLSQRNSMWAFEQVRAVAEILRKDGYSVWPDNYVQGQGEDEIYVAGIRFLMLDRRDKSGGKSKKNSP